MLKSDDSSSDDDLLPDEDFDLGINSGDDAETLAAKALEAARKRGSVDR